MGGPGRCQASPPASHHAETRLLVHLPKHGTAVRCSDHLPSQRSLPDVKKKKGRHSRTTCSMLLLDLCHKFDRQFSVFMASRGRCDHVHNALSGLYFQSTLQLAENRVSSLSIMAHYQRSMLVTADVDLSKTRSHRAWVPLRHRRIGAPD